MEQDFTKRIAIVVKDGLEPWQAANAISHVAAYLGNKMKDNFDTGSSFDTSDGVHHPRNSQYPIVILKSKSDDIFSFAEEARKSGLLYLGFFREMIETTDDSEIVKILKQKEEKDLEYFAVGVFGPNENVKSMTKKFSLWK